MMVHRGSSGGETLGSGRFFKVLEMVWVVRLKNGRDRYKCMNSDLSIKEVGMCYTKAKSFRMKYMIFIFINIQTLIS